MSTNYCAELLDQWSKLEPDPGMPMFRASWLGMRAMLPSAIKFRLPDAGHVLGMPREQGGSTTERLHIYAPGQRLPYEVMAVEFASPPGDRCHEFDHSLEPMGGGEQYDATIILLTQLGHNIIGMPAFRGNDGQGGKRWFLCNFSFRIDLENGLYYPLPATEIGAQIMQADQGAAINDVIGEASTVVELLCALACSNSEIRDDEPPSPKLNKKRAKKGKTPFHSYKVLTIKERKTGEQGDVSGSHASPRVHLRRGHIRRLAHKTVWVNAAVVGDKSRGIVTKDYRVEEGSVQGVAPTPS